MELKPLFRDIAAAIREKEGTTELIPANTFAQRIRAIETSGALPNNVRTITLFADPPEGGTVSGGGTASDGMTVTVRAEAAGGYSPAVWQENGQTVSEDAEYTFSVSSERTLTAVFSAKPASRLPDGYTEVEYISNPNLGYIWSNDAKWFPDVPFADTRMELSVKLPENKTKGYFFGNMCLYYSDSTTVYKKGYNCLNYTSEDMVSVSTKATTTTTIPATKLPVETGIMDIVIDVPKGLYQVGENTETISTKAETNGATKPSLFAASRRRTGSGPTTDYGFSPMDFNLYSIKTYNSTSTETGDLTHDFVPCIDSNGTVGIYDLITEAFWSSHVVEKPFVAGPAVS